MQYCQSCGAQNADGQQFCVSCGSKLTPAEAAPNAYNPNLNQNQNPYNAAPNPYNANPNPYNANPNPYNPYNAAPVYGMPGQIPGKGLAVASMVCGIVGIVFSWCWGVVLGILAIVFGGVAKSKMYRGSMATAGIALGIVTLAMFLIFWWACYDCVSCIDIWTDPFLWYYFW